MVDYIGPLIGVAGLAGVLWLERRERYRARLDETLSAVVEELARRVKDLEHATRWEPAEGPLANVPRANLRAVTGGPRASELQAAVDVASMAGRRRWDRPCMEALAGTVNELVDGVVQRQMDAAEKIGSGIRAWRSGAIGRRNFIETMARHRDESIAAAAEAAEAEAAST